jgi:signal transduction histidine kinase
MAPENTPLTSGVFLWSLRRPNMCFEVHDTGIGIAGVQRARLFSFFSQADASITRQYGGAGPGLSICPLLVIIDERRCRAPGKGSLFWFYLPMQLAERMLAAEDNTINLLVC